MHADGSVGVHFDDGIRAVEFLFGDSDDGDVVAVKADAAADDVGVAGEASLPIAVAKDDYVAGLGLIAFTGKDEASDGGANSKHRKEIAGDLGDDGAVGAAVSARCRRGRARRQSCR